MTVSSHVMHPDSLDKLWSRCTSMHFLTALHTHSNDITVLNIWTKSSVVEYKMKRIVSCIWTHWIFKYPISSCRRLPRRCSLSFLVASSPPLTLSMLLNGARVTSWLSASASSSPPASCCCNLPSLACTTWACRSASPCSVSYTRR